MVYLPSEEPKLHSSDTYIDTSLLLM